MLRFAIACCISAAIAAPAMATTLPSGSYKLSSTKPVYSSSTLQNVKVKPPCTAGSLGYTYFFGAYGEPEKKDNCTGAISSNY